MPGAGGGGAGVGAAVGDGVGRTVVVAPPVPAALNVGIDTVVVVGVADVTAGALEAGVNADDPPDDEAIDGATPAGDVLPVPADELPRAVAEASAALLCGLEQAAMVTATNPNTASDTVRFSRVRPGHRELNRWRPSPLRETCTASIVTRARQRAR